MNEAERPREAFEKTRRTWLMSQVQSGGIAEANQHVMTVYAEPLKVYFLGSSFRWMGEPEDMVAGFFADRLPRENFLSSWLKSGRPLRFWLIVGFKHFLLEQSRKIRSARNEAGGSAIEEVSQSGASPEEAFDRQCSLSIVVEAMRRSEAECTAVGQGDHWRIFLEHYKDGHEYANIAPKYNVDRARAAVMARTAAGKFKSVIRDLVSWPGATPDQIDHEIQLLLEGAGR